MNATRATSRIGHATLALAWLAAAAWSVDLSAHGVSGKDAVFLQGLQGRAIGPLLYLGAKHMVTGYDHLLFLVGVIFFLYRLKDVLLYVSLFTVGHSLTLLGGVLGGVRANPFLIDAVIGFSVVYKAFENMDGFRRVFGFQPNTRAAVLLFGLFHGFGLATKLQEFDLAPQGLATTTPRIIDHSTLSDVHRFGRGMDRRTADFARVAEKLERKLLVVKTIVDFYNREPFPDYSPYGCRASAECLLHILQHIFTPDERPLPSPPTSRRETFLESITIHNFKNIQRLEFDLLQPSALPGRWTCIAGLNGAGKSAILQAIAIVLLGDSLATQIGGGLLARARRMTNDEFLPAEIRATVRSGQEQIDLFLPLDENGVNEPHLQADERSYQKMREFWIGRKRNHLLLAYGAGRNLSEHRDTRHKDKDDETRRQMTLFDPLTQVASVDVLLEQGERAKPILAMLKRLLDAVLVDVQFSVEESATGLTFRCGDAVVPASELPDGFRATIAWLADICATWFKKAPEEAAKDGDPSKIRGIVLIDEIDLHLHASLQRVLVPNLRKALPHVQWIVTTHSPLVVSSFDRREIVLLKAGPHGPERKEVDRQILGFSSDEVYEYLMAIEPHSAALDEKLASGEGGAELAHILAQSPTVSDEQATEERTYLDDLAKLRDVSPEAEPSKEG